MVGAPGLGLGRVPDPPAIGTVQSPTYTQGTPGKPTERKVPWSRTRSNSRSNRSVERYGTTKRLRTSGRRAHKGI